MLDGSVFLVPLVCCAALGYPVVPIGTRTYSFHGLAVMSVFVVYFFFFFYFQVILMLVYYVCFSLLCPGLRCCCG